MIIGYVKGNTKDQYLKHQILALNDFGCELIYQEHQSGRNKESPELERLLNNTQSGDKIVICRLDCLGRSLKNLIEIVQALRRKNVDFVSLNDHIDTSTSLGHFTFNLFTSLAEYQRNTIVERTKAGLSVAKAHGMANGKPKGYSKGTQELIHKLKDLSADGKRSVREIVTEAGVSKTTYYRYIEYIKENNPQ